jgi:aldehyde:ferredoxin oxidoreductase
MLLDVSLSNASTDEASLIIAKPESLGLSPDTDLFSPDGAAAMLAAGGGLMPLEDSMVICKLTLVGTPEQRRADIINAVTGWDFSVAEGRQLGRRVIHLLKAFNVRHGHTPSMEEPSPRYASAPSEGPGRGKSFLPMFEKARCEYYRLMGWDIYTGKPLPETLENYELGYVIKDLWQ